MKESRRGFYHLFGGPLESSDYGILDFVKVLHSLCTIEENVWSSTVGTEAPDFTGFGDVVVVLVAQVTSTDFEVVSWVDVSLEGNKVQRCR